MTLTQLQKVDLTPQSKVQIQYTFQSLTPINKSNFQDEETRLNKRLEVHKKERAIPILTFSRKSRSLSSADHNPVDDLERPTPKNRGSVDSRSQVDKSLVSRRKSQISKKRESQSVNYLEADGGLDKSFNTKRSKRASIRKATELIKNTHAFRNNINSLNIVSDFYIDDQTSGVKSPKITNFKKIVRHIPATSALLKSRSRSRRNVEFNQEKSPPAKFRWLLPSLKPKIHQDSWNNTLGSLKGVNKKSDNKTPILRDPRSSIDIDVSQTDTLFRQDSPVSKNLMIDSNRENGNFVPLINLNSLESSKINQKLISPESMKVEHSNVPNGNLKSKEQSGDNNQFFLYRTKNSKLPQQGEKSQARPAEITEDPMAIINAVYQLKLKRLKNLEKRYQMNYTSAAHSKLQEPVSIIRHTRPDSGFSRDQNSPSPVSYERSVSIRKSKKKRRKINAKGRFFDSIQKVRSEEDEEFLKVWGGNRCGGLYKKFPFEDQTQLFIEDAKLARAGGPLILAAARRQNLSLS